MALLSALESNNPILWKDENIFYQQDLPKGENIRQIAYSNILNPITKKINSYPLILTVSCKLFLFTIQNNYAKIIHISDSRPDYLIKYIYVKDDILYGHAQTNPDENVQIPTQTIDISKFIREVLEPKVKCYDNDGCYDGYKSKDQYPTTWACGSACPGGKYKTDTGCNCSCIEAHKCI